MSFGVLLVFALLFGRLHLVDVLRRAVFCGVLVDKGVTIFGSS